jgi:hypothetical protein
MVSLAMVVSDELGEGAEETTLPEEDQAVEASSRIEGTKRSA